MELVSVVDRTAASGLPHGEALLRLADAMVGTDDASLARAREELAKHAGWPIAIAAIGVASNFERMVRIADGAGITLDGFMLERSTDLRSDLGIDAFGGAARSLGAMS